MLLLYLCCFFLSDRTVIVDSIIFKVDVSSLQALKITLGDDITDHVIDDHIYALTSRYLYKIDLNSLRTIDRIPLPQRFNYITAGTNEIILVSTSEIITVDKKNFSFLSGIGIEPGDYRPVFAPKLLAAAKKDHLVYLVTDDGHKSLFKIFDMKSGKLVKRLSTPMITSCRYDLEARTLMYSDINDHLVFRDLDLKTKKDIKLHAVCSDFKQNACGYFFGNQQGIYAADRTGKIIDVQPIYACRHSDFTNFLFVTDNYLLFIDTLTLRIRSVLPNEHRITQVAFLDDLTSVGRNAEQGLFLIDNNRFSIEPLAVRDMLVEKTPTLPAPSTLDSLWYLQFGAFSRPDYASAFCDSIAATGLPVLIDSGIIYRVELGGFLEKTTAIEVLEALNAPAWTVFGRSRTSTVRKDFVAGGKRYLLQDGIIRKE
jgi:hypothetical protein